MGMMGLIAWKTSKLNLGNSLIVSMVKSDSRIDKSAWLVVITLQSCINASSLRESLGFNVTALLDHEFIYTFIYGFIKQGEPIIPLFRIPYTN